MQQILRKNHPNFNNIFTKKVKDDNISHSWDKIYKKEISKEQTQKQENNQKGSSTKKENLETKSEKDLIEWIYIDANKNRFVINDEKSIEWDAEKKHAIVTSGEMPKTFFSDDWLPSDVIETVEEAFLMVQ